MTNGLEPEYRLRLNDRRRGGGLGHRCDRLARLGIQNHDSAILGHLPGGTSWNLQPGSRPIHHLLSTVLNATQLDNQALLANFCLPNYGNQFLGFLVEVN